MVAGVLERNAVETELRRAHAARVLVGVITLATFGPYLFGGIRTEQVVIYLVGIVTIPALGRLSPSGGLRFLIPWVLYIIVASLSVLAPSMMVAPQDPGNLLAGYDNILPPLLLMLIIWTWVPAPSAQSVLDLFAKLLASIMAANGAVAIIAT